MGRGGACGLAASLARAAGERRHTASTARGVAWRGVAWRGVAWRGVLVCWGARVVCCAGCARLVLAKCEHQVLQDGLEVRHELQQRVLLEGGEGGAGGLLHLLVVVEHALEELLHQRPQVAVALGGALGVLGHDPLGVARQRPTRDAPDERLRVVERLDQPRHELRQVRLDVVDAPLGDGPQREDARLPHLPWLQLGVGVGVGAGAGVGLGLGLGLGLGSVVRGKG